MDEEAARMALIRDDTVQKVKSVCEKKITELFQIWEETGIRTEILNTYADQVYNHVVGLMRDMVHESNEKKKELLKSVKTLAQSARKLAKELGTNFETNEYVDLPVIELEQKLKTAVGHFQQLKEQRSNYVQELNLKESELCKKMGAEPVGFTCSILSEQKIEEYENRVHSQESEMNRLSELFKDARESIIKMMDELQVTPALDFENLVCHHPNKFIYSSKNMTKLSEFKQRLRDQVDSAKSQVQEKKATLMALWDYLNEPEENRQLFLKNYSGYNLITLSALDNEIKRCRKKRSENVANYVSEIRKEIENLWNLCKYGELQKKSFAPMKCQTYTDDLLLLHEMEAENLRKHYNTNRKIFELLNEWEVQFEKLKELDRRANDPDRYHNRGGQLLLEEKERKAAEKKIPKLENQLYILADEYEDKYKKTFLVNGYSMREFMNNARESYDSEKENMKLARKQAKNRSVRKTPLSTTKRTPGASMLRITPASGRFRTTANMSRVTPLAKRKLPYDVSSEVSEHKKRATTTEKYKNTVLCNKVRRSGRISGGVNSTASGRVRKCTTTSKKRMSKSETILSVSAYGSFQGHLEDRPELRSSVLPVEIPSLEMKTPIKPVRRKILAVSTPSAPNSHHKLRSTSKNPPLTSTPKPIPVQNLTSIEL